MSRLGLTFLVGLLLIVVLCVLTVMTVYKSTEPGRVARTGPGPQVPGLKKTNVQSKVYTREFPVEYSYSVQNVARFDVKAATLYGEACEVGTLQTTEDGVLVAITECGQPPFLGHDLGITAVSLHIHKIKTAYRNGVIDLLYKDGTDLKYGTISPDTNQFTFGGIIQSNLTGPEYYSIVTLSDTNSVVCVYNTTNQLLDVSFYVINNGVISETPITIAQAYIRYEICRINDTTWCFLERDSNQLDPTVRFYTCDVNGTLTPPVIWGLSEVGIQNTSGYYIEDFNDKFIVYSRRTGRMVMEDGGSAVLIDSGEDPDIFPTCYLQKYNDDFLYSFIFKGPTCKIKKFYYDEQATPSIQLVSSNTIDNNDFWFGFVNNERYDIVIDNEQITFSMKSGFGGEPGGPEPEFKCHRISTTTLEYVEGIMLNTKESMASSNGSVPLNIIRNKDTEQIHAVYVDAGGSNTVRYVPNYIEDHEVILDMEIVTV
jgi:hypothetical protein